MLKKVLTISTSIIMLIVMMTNIVLPVYALNTPNKSSTKIQDGVYCIKSMVGSQSRFLDIWGAQEHDNVNLQIYQKNAKPEDPNGSNQQFFLWCDGDGYYTIIPMHTISRSGGKIDMSSAKCIGVEDFNGEVGTKITQRNLSFNDNCKWAIDAVDKDKNGNIQYEFTLKSKESKDLKLNVINAVDSDNTFLQLNTGNKLLDQRFTLENNYKLPEKDMNDIYIELQKFRFYGYKLPNKLDSGVYNIRNMVSVQERTNKPDYVLDVQGNSDGSLRYDDATFLQLYQKNINYTCNGRQIGSSFGTENQQFYLWRDPRDGYYTIMPMNTIIDFDGNRDMSYAMCIGVKSAKDGQGTKISQCKLSFDDNCKWAIENVGNGQYEFTLKSNGLKLDLTDGNKANSILKLNTGADVKDQQFSQKVLSQRFQLEGKKENSDEIIKYIDSNIPVSSKHECYQNNDINPGSYFWR